MKDGMMRDKGVGLVSSWSGVPYLKESNIRSMPWSKDGFLQVFVGTSQYP